MAALQDTLLVCVGMCSYVSVGTCVCARWGVLRSGSSRRAATQTKTIQCRPRRRETAKVGMRKAFPYLETEKRLCQCSNYHGTRRRIRQDNTSYARDPLDGFEGRKGKNWGSVKIVCHCSWLEIVMPCFVFCTDFILLRTMEEFLQDLSCEGLNPLERFFWQAFRRYRRCRYFQKLIDETIYTDLRNEDI